ncbi:Oidioi.mRNA.OKI2018_I69.XSR.g16586.t1.cds [Oikopleura dioica]|uniref:Oidioi.mRNA.OKI2018_I69.XSR.g16586.t1.cds n=1 Tax=Oikopleura dioica TaxID=34765 RepID=A0ABN7SLF1_OIKDI|nr:Oidioi.mRNA.OKI2018_I69.XSR.g16586.t1.cds [Oikopleura dioica]
MKDYYRTLDVTPEASTAEIKKAYHKMARKFHPDKNKAKDAHEMFIRIKEAYEVLSDPVKRKQFEAARAGPRNSRRHRSTKARRPHPYKRPAQEKEPEKRKGTWIELTLYWVNYPGGEKVNIHKLRKALKMWWIKKEGDYVKINYSKHSKAERDAAVLRDQFPKIVVRWIDKSDLIN